MIKDVSTNEKIIDRQGCNQTVSYFLLYIFNFWMMVNLTLYLIFILKMKENKILEMVTVEQYLNRLPNILFKYIISWFRWNTYNLVKKISEQTKFAIIFHFSVIF